MAQPSWKHHTVWLMLTWWPKHTAAPSTAMGRVQLLLQIPSFASSPLCFSCSCSYIIFGREACYSLPNLLFFRDCSNATEMRGSTPVRKVSCERALPPLLSADAPCRASAVALRRCPCSTAHPHICPLSAQPVPSGDIYHSPWDTLLSAVQKAGPRGRGRPGRAQAPLCSRRMSHFLAPARPCFIYCRSTDTRPGSLSLLGIPGLGHPINQAGPSGSPARWWPLAVSSSMKLPCVKTCFMRDWFICN